MSQACPQLCCPECVASGKASLCSLGLSFLISKVWEGPSLYLLRAAWREAQKWKLFLGVSVGGLQACRDLNRSGG